jgi:hypothetical protein
VEGDNDMQGYVPLKREGNKSLVSQVSVKMEINSKLSLKRP